MNYIDEIAWKIAAKMKVKLDGISTTDVENRRLYRMYALLALTKGDEVDLWDVHDAWVVWKLGIDPNHPSIIPFPDLPDEIKELDRPYADAIQEVMCCSL